MEWVQTITTASGRRFQSMPNGDFLAFYPDYFGWSNDPNFATPYLLISDLEIIDLSIDLTDDNLVTHLFTVGDVVPTGTIDYIDKIYSAVASVETMGAFKSFIIPNDLSFDARTFLQRFGARPRTDEIPEIKHPIVQFLYGWMNFLKQWAEQFDVSMTTTVMPELWPGGRVQIKNHDLILFVEEVTHNFDRANGFTTTARLSSPTPVRPNARNSGLALLGESGGPDLTALINNAIAGAVNGLLGGP